jgi:hypothetical protein
VAQNSGTRTETGSGKERPSAHNAKEALSSQL